MFGLSHILLFRLRTDDEAVVVGLSLEKRSRGSWHVVIGLLFPYLLPEPEMERCAEEVIWRLQGHKMTRGEAHESYGSLGNERYGDRIVWRVTRGWRGVYGKR